MTCFRPLSGWQSEDYGGSLVIGVDAPTEDGWRYQPVACRRCGGCHSDYSRDMMVRCTNEASMYDGGINCCFVTLTYDDEHLRREGLCKRDGQLFMKRLRYERSGCDISMYGCGEYGERFGRAHLHLNLFGVRFDDMEPHSRSGSGQLVYVSDELSKLWTAGHAVVQPYSKATAAYCAGYVSKKWFGEAAEDHYRRFDELGEYQLTREFALQSLRPALGLRWIDKWFDDVYPHDRVVIEGRCFKPPKYYDRIAKGLYPEMFAKVAARRLEELEAHAADMTPARLAVREECLKAQLRNKRRDGVK